MISKEKFETIQLEMSFVVMLKLEKMEKHAERVGNIVRR
jgi:hypothetical protein